MADFIIKANIANYRHHLTYETDPVKIAMIHKLIAEEEAKLAEWHKQNPTSKAE